MAEKRKKLLIVSDSVSGQSGLARIARDIAVHAHTNLSDLYELATAGYGGCGSAKLGFQQYHLEGVQSDWVLPSLQEIVEDFAGKERCIVLFIWDPSRLGWFSQPERLGSENLLKYPGLKQWLIKANIERWIYAPVDASGPNDRLTFPLSLALQGFDRILAYGPFGEGVIRRTLGDEESDKRHLTWLPHGIDDETFFSLDQKLCRRLFLKHTGAQSMFSMFNPKEQPTPPIAQDETLIGIVATNQLRKDWHLGLQTCSILARDRKLRVWIHTDSMERDWSIPSLLVDYGLIGKELITLGYLPDSVIAEGYSACDFTLGIGAEGWGFPLAESQFCGTPVVTGSYAGGGDIVPREWQVDPVAFRYEGSFSCKRPVYDARMWAMIAENLIGKRCNAPGQYKWSENWKGWEAWFREAAK